MGVPAHARAHQRHLLLCCCATQTNRIKDGEEPGPDTELEYWRTRMSNFNSITEQLKMKECQLVLRVCQTAKTHGFARWKSLDIQVCWRWVASKRSAKSTNLDKAPACRRHDN